MAMGGGKPRLRGIKCPKCRMVLPSPPGEGLPMQLTCIRCKTHLNATPFPALHQRRVGKMGTDRMSDQESSCFYHEQKQAASVCEHCGRFLCSLCEVQWHQQTLCPDCITHGRKQRNAKNDLSTTRIRYDSQTLILGLLPLLLWPLLFLSWIFVPAAIITAVRHRKETCSFLPARRSNLRFTLGLFFAVIQLVAMLVLAAVIFDSIVGGE
jgi:hypothetical protein